MDDLATTRVGCCGHDDPRDPCRGGRGGVRPHLGDAAGDVVIVVVEGRRGIERRVRPVPLVLDDETSLRRLRDFIQRVPLGAMIEWPPSAGEEDLDVGLD